MTDPIHQMLVRARLTGLDDSGGLQRASATGLRGTTFSNVLRPQPFGFSSTPPNGSVGWLMQQSGSSERAFALGFEHPDHRPAGLERGGTVLYDASGQVVSIVNRKIRMVGGDEIHLLATTIILEGNVKLGGPGASRPASAQGTVDSGGQIDTSNFASKVFVE